MSAQVQMIIQGSIIPEQNINQFNFIFRELYKCFSSDISMQDGTAVSVSFKY